MKGKRVIPHILSFSRLALGAGFYLVIMRKTPVSTVVALGLMILSLLTDYWDGKLARRHDAVTMLGKWIDPFSDFLFFLAVYAAFYSLRLMPLILLILFLVRELSMYTVIRPLYMVKKLDPAAKLPGKIKMVGQISGSIFIIVCLFFYQVEALPFPSLPGVVGISLRAASCWTGMSRGANALALCRMAAWPASPLPIALGPTRAEIVRVPRPCSSQLQDFHNTLLPAPSC